jgi:alpha-L-fucosidase
LYAGKAGINKLLNTGSEDGTHWIPAEVDVSIRPGWFYHNNEDSLVKTPQKLFDIYLSSVGRGSVLLLNVPPDQRGLFHERDIKSLYGFRNLLQRELGRNRALNASASASNVRGNAFAASNVTDNNNDTYWATNDEVTAGFLEINLGKVQTVKYILLQEYIQLGQRVKAFDVEVWTDDAWHKVASATTIGYKRILKLTPVQTGRVRVNITASKACPVISNVAIY